MSEQTIQNKRSYGIVGNLEKYLPPEWWKNCFNAMYLKTDGDIVENAENTKNEVDFIIHFSKLKPQQRILDLCCGQGRHAIELAERGFSNITGFDYSEELLAIARATAEKKELKIDFHQGDMRFLEFPEKSFDCILMMGNSFGYFESRSDDISVLNTVFRLLTPGGMFILDLCNGEWQRSHFKPRSWEWLENNCLVCRERALSEGSDRIISREIIINTETGVMVDQFYAERLYSKDEITECLRRTSFADIKRQRCPHILSSRNQDMGFMENRMVFTAKRPKEEADGKHA